MLLSATKSRKKQQTELIQNAINDEEIKKRKERENCYLTSAPILYRGSKEPSLYTSATDDHKEESE